MVRKQSFWEVMLQEKGVCIKDYIYTGNYFNLTLFLQVIDLYVIRCFRFYILFKNSYRF